MNSRLRCAAAALLLTGSALLASPPPISAPEKAACQIVADYLARGPVAVLASCSPGSQLCSDRRTAADEIEARLGPREGAFWELRTTSDEFAAHGAVFHVVFPSGAEDVIAFFMSERDGTWKVDEIRTLAELSPDALQSAAARKAADQEQKSGVRGPAAPAAPSKPVNLQWLLFVAPILSIAGAITRRSHVRLSSAALLAALVAFAIPVASAIDPNWRMHLRQQVAAAKEAARPSVPAPSNALAPLVSTRRALASGTEFPPVVKQDGLRTEVAQLWKAQMQMGSADPQEVRKQLDSFALLRTAPMASLLRARLLADEGERTKARAEYATMRGQFVQQDSFDLEEGFLQGDQPADPRPMGASGPGLRTRDASLYYVQAIDEIVHDRQQQARAAFREGWRLQPMSRASVISAGAFALLLRDPTFSILLNVNTPEESTAADLTLSRSPMAVPPGTRASASGMYVRLRIGDAELDIPGGAMIAPRGTSVVSATDLEKDDSNVAIERAAKLTSQSLSSASSQRIIETACEALASHNRWDELLQLTSGIKEDSDNVPASLVMWRVRGLLRANRKLEASQLMNGAALAREMQRNPDAGTLIAASNLLSEAGAWPEAEEKLHQVSSLPRAPDVGALLHRLQLLRQLASSSPTVTTEHFAVHTTPDIPSTVAQRIGELLEAELKRVSAQLHTGSFSPVRVNVLHWAEFSGQLTFTENILGFYNGEITIPFGDVQRFRDRVVAILTHEMTHAVVAQATNDNAPRWFQEGMAQRMELVERQENIFQIRRAEPPLALELIDPMMTSVDPVAVGDAYITAQTVIRFIEDRYGADAVTRLMAEFRAGHDSDEALRAVTGKGLTEVDRDFRAWGATHASAFIDRTPWPYIQYYSLGIDPTIQQSIRFSRPKPKP